MLSRIVEGSLKNRPLVMVGAVALLVLGVVAAYRLPIDVVPDVTNRQVQVITSAPALSPLEIEQYVSVPVERAMSGIPYMTELRSLSKYGISVVTIVFADDTPIHLARQLVSERMPEAQRALARQDAHPELAPMSTALGEVYQFALRGEAHSLLALEETLDWFIAPQLRMVPGVVETLSFGGEDKQYQIVVDPARLQASGLSIAEVAAALEAANANAGGGYVERHREQILIGTKGLVTSLSDLRSVVIGRTPEGLAITVASIADVRFGPRLRRGSASMDGQGEVVVGTALMLLGENSRVVADLVRRRLDELGPSLPKGMRIEPFYDRAALVERTTDTVLTNLIEGAALVMLVLFLLLGDLRAGAIVAVTIPLSMSVAVIAMQQLGLSGNLMSLGAIDFGLIVDGAVIIVENSLRRLTLEPGRDRMEVVRDATLEVRAASIFGELGIAVVYLPILTLRGVEGKLFVPMATTVLLALAGAFICSLTIVPVLSATLLRPHQARRARLLTLVRRLHVPAVELALRRPNLALGVGFACVVLAAAAFASLGAEFVPQLDEGDILVEARRLPGISLSESIAGDKRMQEALLGVPEVQRVVSKTGSPELAMDPMGVEQTDVYLQLKPRREWRPGVDKATLATTISETLARAAPDIATSISQPIQMRTNELLAGIRSDLAAIIYGPELGELRRLGGAVSALLQATPGAHDVRMEQGVDVTYLDIIPDRAKLARYGLRIADVNQLTETIAVGHIAGEIFEGDRRFQLALKMKLEEPGALAELQRLPLKSLSGQAVPLGDVARLELKAAPALINRERMSRRLVVELNVRGRDTAAVVAEAKQRIAQNLTLPAGYHLEWSGQFQNYEQARARLLVVVPLALALIATLLWIALRAARPMLVVLSAIPYSLLGGAAALALRGIPFSISAAIGFVALFGVSVLNGLVFVSFARELRGRGVPTHEALRRTAELRLRPMLMTAAVAALGMLPMALSSAPGSEVQRPLATVVIGGLASASLLGLFLFPALYARLDRDDAVSS